MKTLRRKNALQTDNGSISAILNPINIEPNLIYEKDVDSDRKISKYTN